MYGGRARLRTRVGDVTLNVSSRTPFFDGALKPQTSSRFGLVPPRAHSALPALGMAALFSVFLAGSDALANNVPEAFSEHHDGLEKRWEARRILITFDRSLSLLDHGPWAAKMAFGTWLAETSGLPELNFAEASGLSPTLKPDGINSVIWAPIPFEGHENDLAITIVFSDPKTQKIIESDIILNAKQPLAVLSDGDHPRETGVVSSCTAIEEQDRCGGRFDLVSVATHEVGHFFGLPENGADQQAVMFQCASPCEVHKRELSASDVLNIEQRYASSEVEHQPSAGCQLAPGETGRRGRTMAFAALLVILPPWRRRRCKRAAPG